MQKYTIADSPFPSQYIITYIKKNLNHTHDGINIGTIKIALIIPG